MDDGTEEYMLKWNSHNTEVISEFHELCRVSNKFSTNMYTYVMQYVLRAGFVSNHLQYFIDRSLPKDMNKFLHQVNDWT